MWIDLSQLSITSHHRQNSTPSLLITSLKLTERFTPFSTAQPVSFSLHVTLSLLRENSKLTQSPQQLTPRFQLRSKLDPTLCPSVTTFKISLSLSFHLLPLFLLELREQCCVDASPCPTTLTPPISSFFPPAQAAHSSAGTQDRPTVVPAHGAQHREAGSGGASEGEEG